MDSKCKSCEALMCCVVGERGDPCPIWFAANAADPYSACVRCKSVCECKPAAVFHPERLRRRRSA